MVRKPCFFFIGPVTKARDFSGINKCSKRSGCSGQRQAITSYPPARNFRSKACKRKPGQSAIIPNFIPSLTQSRNRILQQHTSQTSGAAQKTGNAFSWLCPGGFQLSCQDSRRPFLCFCQRLLCMKGGASAASAFHRSTDTAVCLWIAGSICLCCQQRIFLPPWKQSGPVIACPQIDIVSCCSCISRSIT